MLKFPPKKINSLYGYRTNSSMKSQERWGFPQKYSAWLMIKSGIVYSLTSLPGFFLNIPETIGTLQGIGILIAYAAYLILKTEKRPLKKNLERNEQPNIMNILYSNDTFRLKKYSINFLLRSIKAWLGFRLPQ